MHSIQAISHFVHAHQFWAHIFLLVGVVVEGEFVLVVAGIVAHLKGFPFYEAFIFGSLGALAKTVIWYSIGLGMSKKYPNSKFFRYISGKVHSFLPQFKRQPFISIFISKFIYGINHFTLVFSGYTKIKLATYMKAEILSSLLWVPGLLSIGYFFSHTAFGISRDIRKFTLIVFAFVIGFIALERIIRLIFELFEQYKYGKEEE